MIIVVIKKKNSELYSRYGYRYIDYYVYIYRSSKVYDLCSANDSSSRGGTNFHSG